MRRAFLFESEPGAVATGPVRQKTGIEN